MKNLNPFAVLLPLAALALVVYLSAYTVREDEQSLVLRFGNPIKTEKFECGCFLALPYHGCAKVLRAF